jgi:hypothetical protein
MTFSGSGMSYQFDFTDRPETMICMKNVVFTFHPSFYVGSGIMDEKCSVPDPE